MDKKVYIETYGCQMNVADSEVVVSVLKDQGYDVTGKMDEADLILVNTCSIRENAEQRIWGRLKVIGQVKRKNREVVVGLIGCMAERLREKISEREQLVDIIAGPDSYRNLPELVNTAVSGRKAINVKLLKEETYSDIAPLRYDTNNVTAFVSIMRGCNNMCAYCVVPYVRGAERSRDPDSIVKEITDLTGKGYREVTLIGQNVNSYRWQKGESSTGFPELLERVALLNPSLRVRFSTSHPKDISDKLLHTISKHRNICRHIHLPAQSGSNRILNLMNREY
ncbi:MAG: MiaB/RimO family radical SAM methylthiotransferase, partial [Bacteroidales bacterium]|nr:MiaB/RimO family radical SAM methylthiotransferase [Bacteroidales bacterium]